jgi:hypothetical protein
MKMIRRSLYKNRDDPKPRIAFKDRLGQPVDFAAVVRLVLVINPVDPAHAVTVDTAIDGGAMPISLNAITFDIAELSQVVAMSAGEYYIDLTAIDGAGEKSELVHHKSERYRVIFSIRETETV